MPDKPIQDATNRVPSPEDELLYVKSPTGTPTDANTRFDEIPLNILGQPNDGLEIQNNNITVIGDGSSNGLFVERYPTEGGVGANFVGRGARGTKVAPVIPNDQDRLTNLIGQGWDGASFRAGGRVAIEVDGTPATGSMPGKVDIETTPDGSVVTVPRMSIKQDGKIDCLNNPLLNVGEAVNLDDAAPLSQIATVAQFMNTDTTTNINVVSPGIEIPILGTEEFLDAGFTLVGSTGYQCNFIGIVEVHCTVVATSTEQRAQVLLRINKNGTPEPGTSQSMYIRATFGNDIASTSITKLVVVNTGDIISFQTMRPGDLTGAITMTDQTYSWIKRIR